MAECGDMTPPDVAAHCDATEPEPKVGLDIGGHGFRPGSDLLESYLAKYRETTARDSLSAMPSEARIISRAAVSNTPFFPQKLPIVLIAGMAVLFIAAGWITTRELLIGNPYRGLAVYGAATAHARFPEPK